MLLGSAPLGTSPLGATSEAAGSGLSITVNTGHIVYAGASQSVNLKREVSISAGHIVYTQPAQTIKLSKGVLSNAGHITYTPYAQELNLKRGIASSVGHIIYSPPPQSAKLSKIIDGSTGHILYTGFTQGLALGDSRYVAINTGHISYTGRLQSLSLERGIVVSTGRILYSGKAQSVSLSAPSPEVAEAVSPSQAPIASVTIQAWMSIFDFSRPRYRGTKMAQISQLSELTELSGSDAFPVQPTSSSSNRKVSLSTLKEFINEDVVATDDKIIQYEAPTATGFNIAIDGDSDSIWLILTPDAGYAAGTITLPALADCVDKQEVLVNCTQAVTTLTVAGNGATVVGAPTTLTVNAFFRLKFESVLSRWYRVG